MNKARCFNITVNYCFLHNRSASSIDYINVTTVGDSEDNEEDPDDDLDI